MRDEALAMTDATRLTGGCQCGAVRYAVDGPPEGADVCHCRMCQRAVGQPFMAVFFVNGAAVTWTRGAPKTYRSSTIAERGFCADCGSPLSFRYDALDSIALMIASLDDPNAVRPSGQFCIESRLDWTSDVPGLPSKRLDDDPPPGGVEAVQSLQFDPDA